MTEDDDSPPRVVCEYCGEFITRTRDHTGQPTTAVGMVTDGGPYECGCPETPERWEVRYESREAVSDPTWMHPDGCRCQECQLA